MYYFKNSLYKSSKISQNKFLEVIKCFSEDLLAVETAAKVGLSARSINSIFNKLRLMVNGLESELLPLEDMLVQAKVFGCRCVFGRDILCAELDDGFIKAKVLSGSEKQALASVIAPTDLHSGRIKVVDDSATPEAVKSFFSYADTRMIRFRGIPNHKFHLHVVETEFRFNHSKGDIYHIVLDRLQAKPIQNHIE